MSDVIKRSLLLRQELARLEARVALCQRCFGPEPRWPARLARPGHGPMLLVLGQSIPRSLAERGVRFGPEASDPSSRAILRSLETAGIPETQIVLGAATLCRPASIELEKKVPLSLCARECSEHVAELVAAVRPTVIVTVGGVALRSLRRALNHAESIESLRFPESVGSIACWEGAYVLPLYFPSGRGGRFRSPKEQQLDWDLLARLWQWINSGAVGPLPRRASRTTRFATVAEPGRAGG